MKNFKKFRIEWFGFQFSWQKIPNFYLDVGQSGFLFNANNFFFHIVDETIQRLVSCGIMNHLIHKSFPLEFKFIVEKSASVLSVEDLDFGFIIWLGCCAVCAVCFILEILIWIFCKKYEHLTGHKIPKKVKFVKVWPTKIEVRTIELKHYMNLNDFRVEKFNLESDEIKLFEKIQYN